MEMFLLGVFVISALMIIIICITYVCLVNYGIKRGHPKRVDIALTVLDKLVFFLVVTLILSGFWIELM